MSANAYFVVNLIAAKDNKPFAIAHASFISGDQTTLPDGDHSLLVYSVSHHLLSLSQSSIPHYYLPNSSSITQLPLSLGITIMSLISPQPSSNPCGHRQRFYCEKGGTTTYRCLRHVFY